MNTISVKAQKFSREETPYADVQNARGFATQLMEQAQKRFESKGKQPNLFVILTETEAHIVDAPLSQKENERIAIGNLVLKLAHDLYAKGVGSVAEAWFFPGATEAEIDPSTLLQREDKMEVLLATASWEKDDSASKVLLVVREGTRTPTLVERPDLFTTDGADGLFVFKKKGEGTVGLQALHRPIMG